MLIGSGKKIYNAKAQQRAVDYHLRGCITDMYKKTLAEIKLNHKLSPSPEMIRNNEMRAIMQKAGSVVQDARLKIAEAEKTLAYQLEQYITSKFNLKSRLKTEIYYRPEISFEEIKEVIDSCIPALLKLKALGAHEGEFRRLGNSIFTEYETLFNNLIKRDIRFATFAPLTCIERNIVQERITLSNKDDIKEVIDNQERLKQNPNSDYVSRLSNEQLAQNEFVAELLDNQEELEHECCQKIVNSTEDMCQSLFQFIVKDLCIKDIDDKTLKNTKIKETLDYCSSAIRALYEYSNNPNVQSAADWEGFDPHTELFTRLMDIDIKFAFFAPKKALNRFDIDFNRFSNREKDIMLKVLINHGLWDNDEFYENYKGPFDNPHINTPN